MNDLRYGGILSVVLGAAAVGGGIGFVSSPPFYPGPVLGAFWLVAGATSIAVGILLVAVQGTRRSLSRFRKVLGVGLTVIGVVLALLGMYLASLAAVCPSGVYVYCAPWQQFEFYGVTGLVILVPGLVLLVTARRKAASASPS